MALDSSDAASGDDSAVDGDARATPLTTPISAREDDLRPPAQVTAVPAYRELTIQGPQPTEGISSSHPQASRMAMGTQSL